MEEGKHLNYNEAKRAYGQAEALPYGKIPGVGRRFIPAPDSLCSFPCSGTVSNFGHSQIFSGAAQTAYGQAEALPYVNHNQQAGRHCPTAGFQACHREGSSRGS